MNELERLKTKVKILDSQNRRKSEEISELEDQVSRLEEQIEALKNIMDDHDFFSNTYPQGLFED